MMASFTDKVIQNFMEDNDFSPLLALTFLSQVNENEASRVLAENPDFITKFLERQNEKRFNYDFYVMFMSQLRTGSLWEEEPDQHTEKERISDSLDCVVESCKDMDGPGGEDYNINMVTLN